MFHVVILLVSCGINVAPSRLVAGCIAGYRCLIPDRHEHKRTPRWQQAMQAKTADERKFFMPCPDKVTYMVLWWAHQGQTKVKSHKHSNRQVP